MVDSASEIAAAFGMSQTLIGLTIVAIGTSLPELVTSVVASTKGENDLAMGNVIGSNIFNILLILGASAAISPMTISMESIYDGAVLLVMSILLFFLAKKGRRDQQKRSSTASGALWRIYGLYHHAVIKRDSFESAAAEYENGSAAVLCVDIREALCYTVFILTAVYANESSLQFCKSST